MTRNISKLIAAQGGKCYICGCDMAHPKRRESCQPRKEWRHRRATLDHVWPKSGNHNTNLFAMACNYCNSVKSNRPPSDDELEKALAIRKRAKRLKKGEYRIFS